ncbi:MAG: prepilin peptidase [Alphaproteobacteria bacterium]|nr:prepilin peptidase [Alphaproteobacteria bacterium]
MVLLILFLISLFVAVGAGVYSGLSDIRGLTIPNIYSGVVAVAFLFAYLAVWVNANPSHVWVGRQHILSGLLTFSITFLLFNLRMLGAADSKLATAYALWFKLTDLPLFLAYMAISGGLVAVASLVIMRRKPFKSPREGSWVARVQNGESKVPYGVAIAAGALVAFLKAGYLSGDFLSGFLSVSGGPIL